MEKDIHRDIDPAQLFQFFRGKFCGGSLLEMTWRSRKNEGVYLQVVIQNSLKITMIILEKEFF